MLSSVVRQWAGIDERPEPRDLGLVLAHELIDEAAGAHLVLGTLGVVGAHRVQQRVGNARARPPLDLLHVVLAVEQVRVDPRPARLEQPPRLARASASSSIARAISSTARSAPR